MKEEQHAKLEQREIENSKNWISLVISHSILRREW